MKLVNIILVLIIILLLFKDNKKYDKLKIKLLHKLNDFFEYCISKITMTILKIEKRNSEKKE